MVNGLNKTDTYRRKNKTDSLAERGGEVSLPLTHHITPSRMVKARDKAGRTRSGRLWFAAVACFCAHGEAKRHNKGADQKYCV